MRFTLSALAAALLAAALAPAHAATTDPAAGRHIAETTCSACHDVGAAPAPQDSQRRAPSFLAISRMPSTTELSIKVYMRTSHPKMPNIILTPDEIDSIAAYITGLAKP